MNFHVRLVPIFSFVLIVAVAEAQSTDGAGSGISKADLAKMRSAKLRFVVPTHVPSGFKCKQMNLERNKDVSLVTLELVYANGKAEIFIEESSEGIGDVAFEDDADPKGPKGILTFSSAIFGQKKEVEFQTVKGAKQWNVQWQRMHGKSFPRFVSASGRGSDLHAGIELLKSLRVLK